MSWLNIGRLCYPLCLSVVSVCLYVYVRLGTARLAWTALPVRPPAPSWGWPVLLRLYRVSSLVCTPLSKRRIGLGVGVSWSSGLAPCRVCYPSCPVPVLFPLSLSARPLRATGFLRMWCVRACACVCACVRDCVRACVRACLRHNPQKLRPRTVELYPYACDCARLCERAFVRLCMCVCVSVAESAYRGVVLTSGTLMTV